MRRSKRDTQGTITPGEEHTYLQWINYLNYKHFIEEHRNASQFNFTSADVILQDFEKSLWTLDRFSTIILLSLYLPIFIISLVGNILIIVTVSMDKTRKASLYYLVNLAMADLAVTVLCMPTSIGTIVYRLWVYGRTLCKLTAFIQGVAVTVGIFSMTTMSVDRYVSMRRPTQGQRLSSSKQSAVLILLMWAVASVFMAPLVYIRNVDVLEEKFLPALPFCIEMWSEDRDRRAYGVFLLFVIFIIPAFTIGLCYGQMGKALFRSMKDADLTSSEADRRQCSRRQAARMLVILICVFIICWFPYNFISALADLSDSATVASVLPFVLWLGHAHSAINPMLYWLLNKRFRESVRRVMNRVKISACSTTVNNGMSMRQYV